MFKLIILRKLLILGSMKLSYESDVLLQTILAEDDNFNSVNRTIGVMLRAKFFCSMVNYSFVNFPKFSKI